MLNALLVTFEVVTLAREGSIRSNLSPPRNRGDRYWSGARTVDDPRRLVQCIDRGRKLLDDLSHPPPKVAALEGFAQRPQFDPLLDLDVSPARPVEVVKVDVDEMVVQAGVLELV